MFSQRFGTVVGLWLAIVSTGCDSLRERMGGKKERPVAQVTAPSGALAALPFSPRVRREAIAKSYRLALDRRFLKAAGTLAELTGAAKPTAATFAEVGELPDFEPLYEKLVAYARSLPIAKLALKGDPAKPTNDVLLFDDAAWTSLAAAQKAWSGGETTLANLALTTRAMTSLAFQATDAAGVADDVDARALALHALADVANAGLGDADRALLAETLGYGAASQRAATKLPEGDPLRAYATFDYATSRTAARARGATATTRLLWLRRSGEAIGRESTRIYARELFPRDELRAPVIGTELGPAGLEERALIMAAPAVMLVHLGAAANDDAASKARKRLLEKSRDETFAELEREPLTPRGNELLYMETMLHRLAAPGPLVPVDVIRALHRAAVFSGILEAFSLEADLLSSAQAARAFYDPLKPGKDAASLDLHTLLGTRVQVEEKGTSKNLIPSLAAMPTLGAPPRFKLFSELQERADWGDTSIAGAARLVAGNVDSRPVHRGPLSVVARQAMDLSESRRLIESALASAPFSHPRFDAWELALSSDKERLRRGIADTRFSTSRRGEILARALSLAPDDPGFRASIAPLLAELPKSYDVRMPLAEALLDADRPREAREIMQPWLEKYEDPTLRSVAARTLVARALQSEGSVAEARKFMGNVADTSNQFGALAQTARLEAALGHPDLAESWASRAAKRYPGSKAGAMLSLVRFLAGDHAGAVRAITENRVTYLDTRWKIAQPLVSELLKMSPAHIDGAIAAMATLPDFVHAISLADGFVHAKRHDLAFRLLSKLKAPGLGQLAITTRAYKAKRAMDGEDAALKWAEGQVPEPAREPLSMFAFSERAPELFALVPEKPSYDRDNVFTWLMRAAMIVENGNDKHPKHAATLAYFKAAPASGYAQLGKMLLGLADEASVEPFVTDNKTSCEAAFYIAHKAMIEGRLDDAAAYYRVSIEAGSQRDGEYRWSFDRLNEIKQGMARSKAD